MKSVDPKTLKGLHLYMNPYSNCSERVMLALAEKGLAVNTHEIDLLGGEQLSEAYLAINPDCDLPALVHDGRPMHDSVTILRYLEETFPEPALSPSDPVARAEMERLLDEASASHMGAVVPWIYATGVGRLPTPAQRAFYEKHIPHRTQFLNHYRDNPEAHDEPAARALLHKQFSRLEVILARQDWLLPGGYSLADIAWAPNANVLEIFGFSLKSYPHLRAWLTCIKTRPAWRQGIQSHMKPLPNWLIRLVARSIRKFGNRG